MSGCLASCETLSNAFMILYKAAYISIFKQNTQKDLCKITLSNEINDIIQDQVHLLSIIDFRINLKCATVSVT